jgi:hypothetical protein
VAVACTSSPPAAEPQTPQPPAGGVPVAVAKWERQVQGAFENRGIAKVEQIGTRWALTVLCGGTHSTYLDDTAIDLSRYVRGYVSARYTWVVRTVTDPKCPKAPCGPFSERRIALQRLTVVSVTEEQARQLATECEGKLVNW